MRFQEWLKNQVERDDPVGDLARDGFQWPDVEFASCGFFMNWIEPQGRHVGVTSAVHQAYHEWWGGMTEEERVGMVSK